MFFGGVGRLMRALASGTTYSPVSLFAAGEQGFFYDFSDFTTMFQDSTGVTPVTAVEQPVGLILDKSRGSTLGSNGVSNGDFSNGSTGWTLGTGWSVSSGIASVVAPGAVTDLSQSITLTAGRTYLITVTISNWVAGSITPRFTSGTSVVGSNFPASNGTFTQTLTAVAGNAGVTFRASGTAQLSVDNIQVQELLGTPSTQSTSAARPVLSARYSFLTQTEDLSSADWNKSRSTVTQEVMALPAGVSTAWKLADNSTLVSQSRVFLTTNFTTVSGRSYKSSFYLKAGTLTQAFTRRTGDISDVSGVLFDTSTGLSTNFGIVTSSSMTAVNDGWYLCEAVFSASTTSSTFYIGLALNGATAFQLTAGTQYVYVAGFDAREANNGVGLPVYQRVTTSTDYATAGFPIYLRFDGVDDNLQTSTLDLSASDKVCIFSGIRKLSTSAGNICEFSTSVNSNNGSFQLGAPSNAGANEYGFNSKGTVVSTAVTSNTFVPPITNVVTAYGDISGDNAIVRINGSQNVQSLTDQGTGNFGSYVLYFGSRAGTSTFLNGLVYNLIVRGGPSSDTEITSTEYWINQRVGAY